LVVRDVAAFRVVGGVVELASAAAGHLPAAGRPGCPGGWRMLAGAFESPGASARHPRAPVERGDADGARRV